MFEVESFDVFNAKLFSAIVFVVIQERLLVFLPSQMAEEVHLTGNLSTNMLLVIHQCSLTATLVKLSDFRS